MAWTANGVAMSKTNLALVGRLAHYFDNPVDTRRNAVFGYGSLPRNIKDNKASNFVTSPPYDRTPIFDRGSQCVATWQGAKYGRANPRVSHKIGTDTSRAALQRAAEKARSLSEQRRTYLDLRTVGKMRAKPGGEQPWAAYRAA